MQSKSFYPNLFAMIVFWKLSTLGAKGATLIINVMYLLIASHFPVSVFCLFPIFPFVEFLWLDLFDKKFWTLKDEIRCPHVCLIRVPMSIYRTQHKRAGEFSGLDQYYLAVLPASRHGSRVQHTTYPVASHTIMKTHSLLGLCVAASVFRRRHSQIFHFTNRKT